MGDKNNLSHTHTHRKEDGKREEMQMNNNIPTNEPS